MPSISVIKKAIAELPKRDPLVVVISGGSTGIGSYIAKAFATAFAADGAKLRVYIVARNAVRSEAVISQARKVSPGSDWRFIQVKDISLLSEVDKCCDEIIKRENDAPFAGGPPRLDLLYMTAAANPLFASEVHPTPEGPDNFFSTLYISRIRMIMKLTPLLQAAPNQSHVISVFAGSFEEVKAGEEPPIGQPSPEKFGMSSVRKHVVFDKNFIFEEFANQYAGKISFIHIYPGLVDGPGFYNPENPFWFKILWRLLYPILWLTYMTSPDTCGQVMAYLATPAFAAKGTTAPAGVELAVATNGEKGGGSYALGQRADPGNKQGTKSFAGCRREGLSKQIWDNAMETIESIEKKNAGK